MKDDTLNKIVDRFGALATTRLNRRSFVRWSALSAGAVVSIPLLAACGGEDNPTATTAPAATEPAATEPAAAEPTATTAAAEPTATEAAADATATPAPASTASATTAPSGNVTDGGDRLMGREFEAPSGAVGTMVEASTLDLRSLHPLFYNDSPSISVGSMIYQTLAHANPETLEPVGSLASGWETNDDASEWTIFLREGIKWHDGEDFDAEDVKFSYDLFSDPASGSNQTSNLNSKLESVEVVDPLTVKFTLKNTVVDFLLDIGGVFFYMFAEHVWKDVPAGDIQSDPRATGADPSGVVGTGPFKYVEWITGDHVKLERNEDFWDGDVYLEEFIYKIVPDQSAAIAQLKTGEVDLFFGIPGSEVAGFAGTDIDITSYDTLSFNFYGYQLDETKSTLFQDVNVRKALLYAIDREAIVETIYFGNGKVAIGTIPVLSWAYNPDGIDPELHYPYDVEKAKALLDEAGWVAGGDGVRAKDGERMSFPMYGNSSSETVVSVLQAYQEYWREIGVEMTPTPEPFQNLVSRITETFDFDAFIVGFGWGPTPDQSMMFKCDSYGTGFNMVKYCNPTVDELLDAAMAELDRDKRVELYTEYQNTLLADLPMAITDFPRANTAVSKRCHNVFPSAQNSKFNVDKWWVDR